MKSVPLDKNLYQRVKSLTKKKFKVYPSAYANAWLVKEYKKRGGRYKSKHVRTSKRPRRRTSNRRISVRASKRRISVRTSKRPSRRSSGLKRWFQEEWINVCKLPRIVRCGRSKATRRDYPYCRPLRKVNKKSPKTARQLSKSRIKKLCSQKRRNPKKRVRV